MPIKKFIGAGEVAQWLRTLTDLPEDLVSQPAHGGPQPSPVSGDLTLLLSSMVLHEDQECKWYTDKHAGRRPIHINNIKINFESVLNCIMVMVP